MDEFSDIWLKISYWSLSHKNDLRKWWVIILLAFDIFVAVFIVTNLIIYFISISGGGRLMAQIIDNQKGYQEYRAVSGPRALEIAEPELISLGSNQYDLIVKVNNPNKNWAAKGVKYKFVINSKETDLLENFILPEEEKFLAAFSVTSPSSTSYKVGFEMVEVNWQRIKDLRKYPETNFEVEGVEYASISVPDKKITIGQVNASVMNDSVYNFWRVDFVAVLYAGNRVVGINKIIVDELKSFEKRNIEFRTPNAPASVSKVLIYPDVNLLDSDNFM